MPRMLKVAENALLKAPTVIAASPRHPPQPEAFLQIFEHPLNGCRIAQAAIEDVMGNRPAVDHHQAHLHLAVAWLAIAAVSKVSKTCRPASLKIGACQVVEDHLDL